MASSFSSTYYLLRGATKCSIMSLNGGVKRPYIVFLDSLIP